ncbi:MAG: hypothetical protein IJS03_02005 [Eubacterium sp.]|nr:hypothetical protein [Eubacterium sp.]
MHSIAYVIPYFGKLPKYIKLWLMTAGCNPTVDFLIFTDDKTEYDYPDNVKVTFMTFEDMQKKVQAVYDFDICLERPYKLCDFKPTYGEVFRKELVGYDFWGHCDMDLIWGDIRKYYTDEVLSKYERVGFRGHSNLYRNTPEVCARYRYHAKDCPSYKEVLSSDNNFAFDEPVMDAIYKELGIPFYSKVDYANLSKYDYSFELTMQTEEEQYKNKNQIFTFKDGHILRHYVYKDTLYTEEVMYLHYWCRPTTIKVKNYDPHKQLVIYPDVTIESEAEITKEYVLSLCTQNRVKYYAKSIWANRKKLTIERIIFNIKGMTGYKKNGNVYTPE